MQQAYNKEQFFLSSFYSLKNVPLNYYWLFYRPITLKSFMISMIAKWVASGKKTLNKPTKYDVRNGKF